jgi:hypothetical protein
MTEPQQLSNWPQLHNWSCLQHLGTDRVENDSSITAVFPCCRGNMLSFADPLLNNGCCTVAYFTVVACQRVCTPQYIRYIYVLVYIYMGVWIYSTGGRGCQTICLLTYVILFRIFLLIALECWVSACERNAKIKHNFKFCYEYLVYVLLFEFWCFK